MKTLLVTLVSCALITGAALATPDTVTAQATSGTASFGNPDDHIAGQWRLPRQHRYERLDVRPDAPEGQQMRWRPVDVTAVPDLLGRSIAVYDRTAKTWIMHPKTGTNPMYLASTYGSGPGQSGSGTASSPSNWVRVHGTVQSVQGSRMTFRADDGRVLQVDMSQVSPNVQQALTQGERATIVAHPGAQPNQLQARWIQQDSSDPDRGGQMAGSPSASPPAPQQRTAAPPPASPPAGKADEKAWQRIHGQVQSVSGSTLKLKADSGKTLTVDVSQVSPNVVKALSPGEKVTVVGHLKGDTDHMAAQFIQQDSSPGAASPKTGPKK